MPSTSKAPFTAIKKKTPRAKVGATSARVEQMRREAFRMLNEGMSCPQIGDVLGVTRERAWQLAKEEMEAVRAETREAALEWRLQLTARHNARILKLQGVVDKATDPLVVVNATARQTAIDVELGKLWGAYAPAKADITSNGETVQGAFAVPLGDVDPAAWAAAALAQSAGEEAEAERVLTGKGLSNEAAPAA